MIRVAVCDDEVAIGSMLERLLLTYGKKNSIPLVIDVFESGEELIKNMKIDTEIIYDILFLDIELKEIDGIETGKFIRIQLRNEKTKIIFISGKDDYYREMIDLQPFAFIHKPLQEKEVTEKFEYAVSSVHKMHSWFEYQINHNNYKQDIRDIIYFVSEGRKVKMVTVNNAISFYKKLADIEKELMDHQFFICHKSYLVNNMHIREVHAKELVMSNKDIVAIGREKREHVMECLLKYR